MKNVYYIHRDVIGQNADGLYARFIRREYLRIADNGRYSWVADPWDATGLTQCQCCNIMANLTRYLRPNYRYDFVAKAEEE